MKFNAIKLYDANGRGGWRHDFREIISINTALLQLHFYNFRSCIAKKIKCRVLINYPVSATLNMTIHKHLATHISDFFFFFLHPLHVLQTYRTLSLFLLRTSARVRSKLQFKCTRLSSIAVHHINFDEANTWFKLTEHFIEFLGCCWLLLIIDRDDAFLWFFFHKTFPLFLSGMEIFIKNDDRDTVWWSQKLHIMRNLTTQHD